MNGLNDSVKNDRRYLSQRARAKEYIDHLSAKSYISTYEYKTSWGLMGSCGDCHWVVILRNHYYYYICGSVQFRCDTAT